MNRIFFDNDEFCILYLIITVVTLIIISVLNIPNKIDYICINYENDKYCKLERVK